MTVAVQKNTAKRDNLLTILLYVTICVIPYRNIHVNLNKIRKKKQKKVQN